MSEAVEEQQPTTESQEQEQPSGLSDAARTALADLVRGVLKEEQTARRAEVRKAWQQRAFRNGVQHIWYDSGSYCYMLPQASNEELPPFMDVYNIYTPHWRSFVSVLSQNPPGVNFVPNDLQRGVDVTAAAYAEKMRHRVDRLIHMKDRQMEAAGLFCTDGRTIAWTRLDEEGQLRVTMHGVLESKVPTYVRGIENWPYCVLSEEVDQYEAKQDYPDYADEIAGSESSEGSYERYARLNILANKKGGFDDGMKNIVTRHTAWIRAARFQKAPADVQRELKAAFADGVKVTVVCDTCVDAVPERLEDAVKVQWPTPGQGQLRPSMLHDLVPIQEAFNDILNVIREHGEYSIPARWVSDTVDSEAIAEQISAPGVTHQIAVPSGSSIQDLVFVETAPSLPAELIANADRLLTLAQFTTGDLPSLFGEGTPDQETASGQKMLSDQAKGQLSAAWAGIQWLFAGVYEQAVKLLAGTSDGPVAISGNSGQDSFDPQAILMGQFGCYPDTDSSFPETMADKRASLQMVLTQIGSADPSIALQPDNLKLVKQYSGLTDLVIPGAEARDKQLEEIEQLLKEAPVPIPMQLDAVSGQMPQQQFQSSVPIGKYDFDQPELDKCKEWLSSRACRDEIRKGNTQGVLNVQLHADLHAQRIQQNAPPPHIEPPRVSMTMEVTDPSTIAQFAQAAGATQTQPEDIAASQVPDLREQAAKTQETAASAIHKSVLAAKEQVAPVKTNTAPEIPGKEK